jgi:hypothetical protein
MEPMALVITLRQRWVLASSGERRPWRTLSVIQEWSSVRRVNSSPRRR